MSILERLDRIINSPPTAYGQELLEARSTIESLCAALREISDKGRTTGYGRGALRVIANRALSELKE